MRHIDSSSGWCALPRRGWAERLTLTLCLGASLVWVGCEVRQPVDPFWSPGDGDGGQDEVVQVDVTRQSFTLANQYIQTSRPQGVQVMFQQLNDVLNSVTPGDDTDDPLIATPNSNDTAADVCPLVLGEPELSFSIGCRDMADTAFSLAQTAALPVRTSVGDQVTQTHQGQLRQDELIFVSAWAREGVSSGVRTGQVQAVGLLRELQVCDNDPTPYQRAFMIGERRARELVVQAEADVLPTIPRTQCNTDSISATVLAVQGVYDRELLTALLIAATAAIAAAQVGILVFKRISDTSFRWLIIVLMLCSGLTLLIREVL